MRDHLTEGIMHTDEESDLSQRKGIDVWSSVEWRTLAEAWLNRQLASAGIERRGDVEHTRLRPWGMVLKVPTTSGPVWFKASGVNTAFEAALYELLVRVAPARVLAPIATDTSRGWIVLPDGGSVLGERFTGADLADALVTVLPQYGQLQLDLIPHSERLLEMGVADMRPATMPRRFDEALEAVQDYVACRGDAERENYRRVREFREGFTEWCERLAAMPVAPSLDHNDLHPWNVFFTGAGEKLETRYYDWGDSVVSHPFASMLVGLGFLQMRLETRVDDARIQRARDAYLEVFTHIAPKNDLIAALELACQVGKVARALTWNRALIAGGEGSEEFANTPFESLTAILEENYLGRV
jgi:hypothetical protein